MRYPYYEPLIAPARKHAQIWRLALGLMLGTVLYYLSILYVFSSIARALQMSMDELSFALGSITTPFWTGVTLFTFICMAVPIFLMVEVLHKRRWHTLFAPWHVEKRMFPYVSAALLILVIALELLPPWNLGLLKPNPLLSAGSWLMILPIAIIGVLIQTSAEEIVFRGYFQSQLAARFNNPIIWMLVPSVIFGCLHYDPNTWGDGAIWPVLWATLFGLCAADLVARSGTLSAAIAFHFVNNLYPLVFAAFPDNLSGFALFHLPWTSEEMLEQNPMLLTDFLFVLCNWLMVRLILKR
ncbi:CPBP family intramembrane glutamic endopeptidase [Halocynthiibacter namhaensis]|uniref:CPBP family intramembrane glutamic endopeptidase n=1 Tax=Halocynthiibacter namhaensis TaxID=1290553 RepID=UPI00068A160D|nr:CPBP family intramembrane glutamic endopeptidase [Halocynthiibacter namhaensis]